ncbi:MAG: hypothetical protein A2W91_06450 [Bacteroidetes bacterium GWF2_38_335]|nr:MAG: hypothetical protein A2W91_06450 [Bacteroidetes bacterium GWF2_38_335]OFY77673.1 MAG: hypothetical protein A2281_17965 [Bacteroidetes bacterium RIFOXYA12_FULL_38_20]HBS89098.1 DUF4843 domain-containing protein [Bacteroidales bacterium]
MKVFIKISVRFLAIAIFLVISNFIYEAYFLEADIQKHSSVINKVRAVQDSCEVIYLGESSNTAYSWSDTDVRSISEMMGAYFPGIKTGAISKGAWHAGNYLTLLRNIPEDSKIKTVVVTLNMRSFNAEWIYSRLETAINKSMVLLQPRYPLINRFCLSFKAYDVKNKNERNAQVRRKMRNDKFDLPFDFSYDNVADWEADVWEMGSYNKDGTRDISKNKMASIYVKTYAFQIDPDNNPRIDDFDEIVHLAKERNWNLVFNLLAENHEKAKELIGDTLVYFMEYNRKLLTDRYTSMGVVVVDNLYAVGDSSFYDQTWTTEHYDQKGRKTVARNVAEALKKFYPNQFVEHDSILIK